MNEREERAAFEGLYENQSLSVHDRLQIGRQLIASYKEEIEALRREIRALQAETDGKT